MSDASGSVGFGVYFRRNWYMEEWLQDWLGSEISRDLTFLELFFFPGACCSPDLGEMLSQPDSSHVE